MEKTRKMRPWLSTKYVLNKSEQDVHSFLRSWRKKNEQITNTEAKSMSCPHGPRPVKACPEVGAAIIAGRWEAAVHLILGCKVWELRRAEKVLFHDGSGRGRTVEHSSTPKTNGKRMDRSNAFDENFGELRAESLWMSMGLLCVSF